MAALQKIRQRCRRLCNQALNRVSAPIIVLLYHRIAKLSSDPFGLAVSPGAFKEQLHALADHYSVVSLAEALCAGPSQFTKPTVVITFDDGYQDNLQVGVPILQQVRLPATFFLSTLSIAEAEPFWWDRLPPDPARIHQLQERAKALPWSERRQWLAQLEDASVIYPSDRALTPIEVKALSTIPGMTIGVHGHTHTELAAQSVADQNYEIETSRKLLEEWTGQSMKWFAYPFGSREDYTPQTVGLLKQLGFEIAVTTSWGQWRSFTNPFRIPRFMVHEWRAKEFLDQMSRFAIL